MTVNVVVLGSPTCFFEVVVVVVFVAIVVVVVVNVVFVAKILGEFEFVTFELDLYYCPELVVVDYWDW